MGKWCMTTTKHPPVSVTLAGLALSAPSVEEESGIYRTYKEYCLSGCI